MNTNNPLRPSLEPLEDRWAPALLVMLDPAGNLMIGDGTSANGTPAAVNPPMLSIMQNADGTVDVGDGLGVNNLADDLPVRGRIMVHLSRIPSATMVMLDGNTAGNFEYLSGNGADTFTISGPGMVGGDLSLRTGNAADRLVINAAVLGAQKVNTGPGDDAVVHSGRAMLAGYDLGAGADTVTFMGTVDGDARFDLGAGSDTVTLAGMIAGHAHFDLGAGADTVTMQGIGNFPAQIGGNARFDLGHGADTVTLGGSIGGNLQMDLGNGSDTVTFDSRAMIGGNLRVDAGNDDDRLTFKAGSMVAGAHLLIHMGNGADSVTLDVMAPQAWLYGDLGTGADTVTIGPAATLMRHLLIGGAGFDVFQKVLPQIKWPFENRGFEFENTLDPD